MHHSSKKCNTDKKQYLVRIWLERKVWLIDDIQNKVFYWKCESISVTPALLKKDWFFFKCAPCFCLGHKTRRDDAIYAVPFITWKASWLRWWWQGTHLCSFFCTANEETAWLPKCIIPSIGTKYVSWSRPGVTPCVMSMLYMRIHRIQFSWLDAV